MSGSIPSVNPLGQPTLSSFGGRVANLTSQIKQFTTMMIDKTMPERK
jgi:hypothetical protein